MKNLLSLNKKNWKNKKNVEKVLKKDLFKKVGKYFEQKLKKNCILRKSTFSLLVSSRISNIICQVNIQV